MEFLQSSTGKETSQTTDLATDIFAPQTLSEVVQQQETTVQEGSKFEQKFDQQQKQQRKRDLKEQQKLKLIQEKEDEKLRLKQAKENIKEAKIQQKENAKQTKRIEKLK